MPRAFGRLTLLRHVARGGMGEIYLASAGRIEGAERPCVVKIIRKEHADDRSFLARFFDETRIQAQLQHPGVVQVLEADTDDAGKPFVVLEHVEGRNLSEVRHRAVQLKVKVDWTEAVSVGVLLAEALAHVHERTDSSGRPLEIVHRDLSPQNVMVGYGGDVKVIDFGTAKGENRRCRTVAGIVYAKPGYVAPEVANETPGGIPADLYAFGVMLWELVAGRRFLSGEATEHMAAVGSGHRNPTPLAQLVACPKELDRVIARATAARVADRYASAREALLDLVALLKDAPSLADGERGVRGRVRHLMSRLYPSEPARSRAEFARLVAEARKLEPRSEVVAPKTPTPAPVAVEDRDNELLPGTRYKLLGEIGRGAMGVVYQAVHVDLARTVALKVLAREHASRPDFLARFRAEARSISQLRHPGIVEMHDFGVTTDGQPFYAMHLLEGETLERYLDREKGMDWREATRVGIEACRALGAAHEMALVHRDLKPANLFLTTAGGLKLLDFGVAKQPGDDELPGASEPPEAIGFVGTAEYLSPEQAARRPVDARSDLYSLGVVLYELVTGRLPHVGESTVALLDAKLRNDPEPARLRAPQRGIPKMLDSTIQRALSREPEARFQSAEEMRAALQEALDEPVRRRARRKAMAYAVLGAVALGIGSVGAMRATGSDPSGALAALARPAMDAGKRLALRLQTAASEDVARGTAADADEEPVAVLEAPLAEPEASGADESDEQPLSEVAGSEGSDALAEEPPPSVEGAAAVAGTDAPAVAAAGEEKVAFAAEPKSGEGADDVAALLAEADVLMEKGATVKAFNLYRKIGRGHRNDARALKAWSEAAARMRGWGEAARVAEQWAALEPTTESRLHLAKMQRVVGRTPDAVKTLASLLEQHPRCEEARALLVQYGGQDRLALNR